MKKSNMKAVSLTALMIGAMGVGAYCVYKQKHPVKAKILETDIKDMMKDFN